MTGERRDARFSFAHCEQCGRLNIYGARCVCDPLPEVDCDCEGGNEQTIGPKCAARIRDTWHLAIQRSREIARHIAERT